MTEREFFRWSRYSGRKGLPFRRLELGLAMIALQIAHALGGRTDAKLEDFLFDDRPDDPADDDDEDIDHVAAAKAAFGITDD